MTFHVHKRFSSRIDKHLEDLIYRIIARSYTHNPCFKHIIQELLELASMAESMAPEVVHRIRQCQHSVINWRDELGNTFLHLTAQSGNCQLVQLSLKLGCNVNAQNCRGYTPLLCSDFTNPRIVESLLKAGADVHIIDNRNGASPLHLAVKTKSLDSVTLLLNAGVDVNHADFSGALALNYAVDAELLDIAQVLVERGTQLNRPWSIENGISLGK